MINCPQPVWILQTPFNPEKTLSPFLWMLPGDTQEQRKAIRLSTAELRGVWRIFLPLMLQWAVTQRCSFFTCEHNSPAHDWHHERGTAEPSRYNGRDCRGERSDQVQCLFGRIKAMRDCVIPSFSLRRFIQAKKKRLLHRSPVNMSRAHPWGTFSIIFNVNQQCTTHW